MHLEVDFKRKWPVIARTSIVGLKSHLAGMSTQLEKSVNSNHEILKTSRAFSLKLGPAKCAVLQLNHFGQQGL